MKEGFVPDDLTSQNSGVRIVKINTAGEWMAKKRNHDNKIDHVSRLMWFLVL